MKCKFCGQKCLNQYSENGGWHYAELDGSYHRCKASELLSGEMVDEVLSSVTETDTWLADKFIKRLALYRYLRPRAKMTAIPFICGSLYDRQYMVRCSDKAFAEIMRRGSIQ
jgi:hypothetical protein